MHVTVGSRWADHVVGCECGGKRVALVGEIRISSPALQFLVRSRMPAMAKDHVGRHVETRFESHYGHVSRTNNSFVSRCGDCETEIGTKKTYSPSKTTVLFPGFMKDLYCCVSLLVDVL